MNTDAYVLLATKEKNVKVIFYDALCIKLMLRKRPVEAL